MMNKIMRRSKVFWAAALALAFASSCYPYRREPDFQYRLNPSKEDIYADPHGWPPYSAIYTQRFVWKMRYMADQLAAGISGGPILVTTFAPVDDIYRGTRFGRLVTEQLMTELAHKGFSVIEARKTADYVVRDGAGEFYLSREAGKIAKEHRAGAALVGTYAASGEQALINARLIDTRDGRVIAAASAMMDLRGDRFLLSMFDETGGGVADSPEIGVRKKVIAAVDPYAEVLREMTRDMAGRVAESAQGRGPKPGAIAVATFVDVNNMYRAVTFGRYMTELLMEDLSSMGYKVIELRAAPEIYIDLRIGELGLTREMSQLFSSANFDAAVLGTYTRAGDKVVVSARMVTRGSKEVVGVGGMTVDAGEENKFVAALLENEVTAVPPTETVEGF